MTPIEKKVIMEQVNVNMADLDTHFDELTNLMLAATALGAATGKPRLAIVAEAALEPPPEFAKNIEQYYIIFGMLGGMFRMLHEGNRVPIEEMAGPKLIFGKDDDTLPLDDLPPMPDQFIN